MTGQAYLDAVAERVVVLDGAFGTYIQGLDLSADDFGGEALEGCNEMLCLTRPDVIRGMHAAFFEVGVDAVETASFGSFSTVLNEYDVADKAYDLNVVAGRIAREVADEFATDGRTRYVAGSIGPGTKLPSLGHIGFAEPCATPTRSRPPASSKAVSTYSSSRPAWTSSRSRRRMIACRRAMKSAGRPFRCRSR